MKKNAKNGDIDGNLEIDINKETNAYIPNNISKNTK